MNTDMHGKKIKSVWWPDSEDEQDRHVVGDNETCLKMSATHHGDHDEFWIVEYRVVDGEWKEAARHNPRYVESIEWAPARG